ncbi:amino acid permease [Janibacter corallicola]|uniref:amino acid permease n=1 Tax=Janibacter corallicola TaxID=415212 RepID=UPI000A03B31D|nr:amino acid permease [Janibacter corallicola]
MSPETDSTTATTDQDHLSRGLNPRHVQFIAFGTAIGTGLFYGSAETIQVAGPAVLLAYAVAGAMVFIVMRALGEMAVRHPVAGSFAQYTGSFLGPWAGYITGWVFWLELAVVAIADMTAVATYMGLWFPGVPGWAWMLAAIAVIGTLNLMAVKVFGEMEFWFSLIKILAILALVVGGIVLILWGREVGGTTPDVAHLWQHDGFAPFGLWGIIMSFSVVVFSFGGIETLGMTAGEADDPERSMPRAVNTVPFRILLFYVGALAVIMAIIPWDRVTGESSPFVEVFAALQVPAAKHLMNFVVLTAALSAMNAIFYACSRTMYGLAEQGHAPRSFLHLSRRSNIPVIPVTIMFGTGLVGVALFLLIEDRLFFYVAAIATFATVFTWLMILLAHWRMRVQVARSGAPATSYGMPFFPVPNVIAIAFMIGVILLLAMTEDGRHAFVVGAGTLVVLTIGYVALVRGRGRETTTLPTDARYAPAGAGSDVDDRA